MKRGSFIKSLATLLAAPSIIGQIGAPAIATTAGLDKAVDEFYTSMDRFRIFTTRYSECRMYDVIVSDLGSTGLITCVNCIERYIEVRPVNMGGFRFKRMGNFRRVASCMAA